MIAFGEARRAGRRRVHVDGVSRDARVPDGLRGGPDRLVRRGDQLLLPRAAHPFDAAVGGDYYTFVIIGMVSIQVIGVGLSAFTTTLDYIIQQGQFETYLVEPVNWRLLPFGLGAWPMLINTLIALAMGAFAVLFGATFVLCRDSPGNPDSRTRCRVGTRRRNPRGEHQGDREPRRPDHRDLYAAHRAARRHGIPGEPSSPPAPGARVLSSTHLRQRARCARSSCPPAIRSRVRAQGVAVLLLIGFLVVLYPLALWLYGRALEYGRKMGLLAGY